jgi:hypothetical protein
LRRGTNGAAEDNAAGRVGIGRPDNSTDVELETLTLAGVRASIARKRAFDGLLLASEVHNRRLGAHCTHKVRCARSNDEAMTFLSAAISNLVKSIE